MEEEDEVQGRGLHEPPGRVELHTRADPVPPVSHSLPCPHFLGQLHSCASGNPDPGSQDHEPRRARVLVRTLAGLVCSHSLNVLDWAAPSSGL